MPVRPLATTSVRTSDRFARRRERRGRLLRWGMGIGAFVLVSGSVYAFFFAPWLSVRSVVVEGAQSLNPDALLAHIEAARAQRTWGYMREHFMIPARPQHIATSLIAAFPALATVTTDKRFPHTIAFTVHERTPVAQWCVASECAHIDASGVRWDPLAEVADLPVIRDMRNTQRWPQDEATILRMIETLRPQLRAMRIEPLAWDLPETAVPELRVPTTEGSELRFSLEDDLQKQTTVLAVFLRDTSGGIDAFEYVDMRIPGRVYSKKKATSGL
ncbi:MAG: hypothetical protein AAB608_00545 [Patescibacteria group bacterium]